MTDRFTVQDKQYMELNPVSERQRREVTGFASGRIESEMKQSFMEVEMVMKKKWMVLMTLTMSLTAASAAWAGVFDNYVDYQNPDGTYSYYFDQGVLVTLDENWYQNTIVKTSDRGATFYQKASYDAYEKEGMEGGRLFTIGASVNSSFSELPSFEYIGFDEDSCMNYYAELPTDYQAYMGDASIQAEYDALWSQVKDVIAGIRIGSEIHAGNETVDVDGNGLGEDLTSTDALFEGIDFDYTTEVPNLNQSETPNLNQPETGSGSTDLNKFLTGGLTGGLSQDSGTEPLADG